VNELQAVAAIACVVVFVALQMWWHFSRSNSLLQAWAAEHGLRIVSQQYCWFRKGPYFWTSSRNQTVYHVTVEDEAGNIRRGYVRCGSWLLGLLSSEVDVRWDRPMAAD
jgi:hypothetical protein